MRILYTIVLSLLAGQASAQSYTGLARASAFIGDGSSLTYSGAPSGAVPYFSASGSSLTFNASGIYFDPINKRLGIRTSSPLHGIDCSSCTLYLDGNNANPILVGNNGSSLTFASNGNLTIAGAFSAATSSVIASAFFGNASALTSFAVATSSFSASSQTIASVTFVGIATNTVTLRGGRPLLVTAYTNIFNDAGGNRTYDCHLTENGALIDSSREVLIAGGGRNTLSFPYFAASSPAGINTFGIVCKTSNATAAQGAGASSVIVQEF